MKLRILSIISFLFLAINLFATEHYVITTTSSISNQSFENFSETGSNSAGGVFLIEETGEIEISNSMFKNNYSKVYGGAMSVRGKATIKTDSIFDSNTSTHGGAICDTSITLKLEILDGVKFIENVATCNGGAINLFGYNNTIIGNNVIFKNNSTSQTHTYTNNGGGGAIANINGYLKIGDNVFFSSNTSTLLGGAIYTEKSETTTVIGSNVMFNFNNSKRCGGAIYNNGIFIVGEQAVFNENSVNYTDGVVYPGLRGGAIYNKGIITFVDGAIFTNNSAIGHRLGNVVGGAIYNDFGEVNLISNTNNVEFSSNIAKDISNAIHDKAGTINLWASKNAYIIFNDRITSENSSSFLNINNSTTTLTANGKIILNEDMSGYTGTVNLYGGEIELQSKMEENSKINTNKFFSGNINLSSGTLNILNNAIDDIVISNLMTTSNINLKIDADLSNNTSDNFIVTNGASGILNLTAINLLGAKGDTTGQITLFKDEKSPELNILATGVYNGYEYSFSTTQNGILNYKYIGNKTFKEVVNDIEPTIRSYSLAKNETVTENLGQLGGTELTIFGNNKNIEGYNVTGIFVAKDKTLNLENINNWSGFNNIYGVIKNEGTLNISGTNFNNNIGQDIVNNGSLLLYGSNSSFEKGIVGIGTTTINGVNINLANAVIEQNKIEINNNGSLISKAQNIVGNIENNGNLILNGGTNNNVIIGTGLTQIYDDVINQANITQNNLEILANKQLTNSTATITVNELLTINNNAKIINDGKLIISGGTNNGTIEQAINTSTTTINGNFVNNGTIKQNKLNIESTGKLTTNANNVETTNGLITNNGILEYTNGTNENKIEGLGHLLISGNVINNNTINQSSITIAGTLNNNNKINAKLKILGQMTTSANNINGNVENNGRLIFDSGINNNTITGTGTIEISSNIVNNSTINQDTIKINNELINNSQIIAKNIYITGQFKLGQTGNFYNATNSTLYNGAQIDLQNNKMQQHYFGNLTINSGIVHLSVDVDLKNKTMDTISATKFTGNGKINVKNINIVEDEKVSKNILLSFADNNLKNKVETDITTAYTSLYKYLVDYDNSTGNFNFFRFSDDIIDNPIAFENTIANQIGAYITQVNVIEQALTNIDSQINVIRHSKNNRNLYASNSNVIFKEKNSIEQGLWLRPYAVSETITVDDTDIKNDAYGTVGGLDLQITNSMLASFYIGYTTSKQSYEEININQAGYLLGLTGSYIAENYYLALTANAIFNRADAQNMFGTDNIENNSYTLAGKTGIDVKLGSKLTLQPNLLLMYSMINTADYVNSQNKKITSDTATNLHIEPSLKLMLNLENQFTPYAIVSMAFNSNSSKVMMEDIVLPEKEIGSYSDLGIGFEKNWNSWNLYLQGTGRFGARQGFGVFGGLKYKFGKANDKISKQLKEKINNKKSADDFETMQLEKQLEKEQKELEEMEKEND